MTTLAEAFQAIGEIRERIHDLEDFAADQDSNVLDIDVSRCRQTCTTLGNHLARLIQAARPPQDDRRSHQTSPEIDSASGRQEQS